MTKIDIFSGFLGAGKTTLIKKLLSEALECEKVVLIENEFGDIGIDGGFLKDAGIEITEMNSGCICCSLVGDFSKALGEVLAKFSPDRILIEPSGVGKLSDVVKAVKTVENDSCVISGQSVVVDAKKCKMYTKNFGEFYNDQIENATCIILSHTAGMETDKINNVIEIIRKLNQTATIISTDWEELSGASILDAIMGARNFEIETEKLKEEENCSHTAHHHHDEHCDCGHHHEHHHDEHCECGHHHEHHHDEHCECGHHHDHHHDEHCECGHHHEHHHDEHCECGHHHDHHHDEHCECGHHHEHHHADEVFASVGIETATKFTKEHIEYVLKKLENEEKYGLVLRAKGIVAESQGKWLHFDYVPGEADIRFGTSDIIGRICVIGSGINQDAIKALFEVKN